MNFLRDCPVLVLGLGDSGLAMARWCARHGAQVQVWDSRAEPPQAATLRAEWPAVTLNLGTDLGDTLPVGVKLVLKSPGLAPHDTRIAPLLAAARAAGIAVMAELDLFAQALADLKLLTTPVAEPVAAPIDAAADAVAAGAAPEVNSSVAALADDSAAAAVVSPEGAVDAGDATDGAAAVAPNVADAAEAAPALTTEDIPADSAADTTATATNAATADAASVKVADAPTAPATDDEPATVLQAPPPPDPAYAPAVLAITGTNGKTTTTAMTALLVERAGRRVAVAGNIGPTLLDRLAAMLALPREEWVQVWVLELSSFQLADARTGEGAFEASAAALLNLSQDHLDWHGDMAAYAAAKARLFGRDAVLVINHDDAQVEALVPAPVVIKTGRGKPQVNARRVLRFGLSAPERPGDFGLVVENGMAWLVRALPVDETLKRRRDEVVEIHLQRLMPADALRVRGRHNAANALAALALATAIGCPLAPMLHALRDYSGEPHRVQWLGTVAGIDAFDDSKGTNVGATVAALDGLGADKAPHKLLLILGGDGKGQDFGPLAAPLARHARGAALIGRDAARLREALQATGVPLADAATLPEAVAWCFAQAQPGDAVLLSPACASLDMFRHYAHRAEVFAAAVRAQAAERGELM